MSTREEKLVLKEQLAELDERRVEILKRIAELELELEYKSKATKISCYIKQINKSIQSTILSASVKSETSRHSTPSTPSTPRSPGSPGSPTSSSVRSARVEKRALNPREDIIRHYQTNNFDESIAKHTRFVKEVMIENPVKTYIDFKDRLRESGPDADFPEFEGVIGYLIKALFQDPEITSFFCSPNYIVLIEQLVNKLTSLQIEGRFNYPYRTTIYCIESMLELLDLYYRNTYKYDNTKPINENMGPYYHIFRYRSYMTTFTDSEFGIPNNIIFPTIVEIDVIDLIKLRCVPILIMGVVDKPIYADQYLNSPLDFWAHDIQHSKRQIQETLRYFDQFIKHNQYYQRRTLYNIRSELDFYKYMEKYTKEVILPIITINLGDSQEVQAQKAIIKMLIFEVVHEKAWPITEKSLCRNIQLRYDEFPVENIKLVNGRITTFHYLFADPTTIGNVCGKLRTGFYDKTSSPNNFIVPIESRTSRNVALAANKLLELIGCEKIPSFEYLLALATDTSAMQEFTDIESIDLPNDPPNGPTLYPPDQAPKLYSDFNLSILFRPKIGTDPNQLHKLDEVLGYDPTFELIGDKGTV